MVDSYPFLFYFFPIIVGSVKQEMAITSSGSFGATSDLAASLATFQQGFQMGPSQGMDDVNIILILILILYLTVDYSSFIPIIMYHFTNLLFVSMNTVIRFYCSYSFFSKSTVLPICWGKRRPPKVTRTIGIYNFLNI